MPSSIVATKLIFGISTFHMFLLFVISSLFFSSLFCSISFSSPSALFLASSSIFIALLYCEAKYAFFIFVYETLNIPKNMIVTIQEKTKTFLFV